MSVTKEVYGLNEDTYCLRYNFSITDIKDLEQIKIIENMLNKIFDMAEDEIEKELYKKGLMTCNAYLENIDDMRKNGNYLVKAHIEEMDKKYREEN